MSQVSVTINDKVYRMACDDGQEEHLKSLARELDQTIASLRRSVGEIGDQRLTVMAAITMADGRAELRREIETLKAEVASLHAGIAEAESRRGSNEAGVAQALEHAAERIESAARRLGAAE